MRPSPRLNYLRRTALMSPSAHFIRRCVAGPPLATSYTAVLLREKAISEKGNKRCLPAPS